MMFNCSVARFVWQVTGCALGLRNLPVSMENLVGSWGASFPPGHRKLAFCGAAAILWTLWKSRNNACFRKQYPQDPAAIIFNLCHNLNSWALLQIEAKKAWRTGARGLDKFWSKPSPGVKDARRWEGGSQADGVLFRRSWCRVL